MSRNQVILLFLLSIAFGLGAVFFAKQWMDRQMQPQTEVEVVEREPVIVTTQEILAGSVIEEQHITTKLLEKAWRDEFQFSNAEDLVGQVVATTIYPGEIVTIHRLAIPGEGSTLASLIPENKRAVTIRVNDVIGVAGFLLPGNKVDVLNTIKYSSTSASTVTVLKEIKVLAVDQTAKTKENKPIIVRAVTLEVSPREAEKLLSAQSKGEIQLALRNPHEEEKVVKRYVAPSVTIIKGTESRNIRVKD
ncbi:pilus assembly protein CpaB [Vibrio coralliilyticus]|jgi:pilus assembly protein CpaB|uniref:Pilus assembly protein CpaB n=1 Tax=Vibrio coralliilyticus TaxID=190893 RepID=A0A1B1V9K6_9VIBR|nr:MULTISPECIES: Flp pilus assembly protein CpaB [Vibrio]ANW23839.1 Flp pilus assembly protein CpaB [Vibrio coralliilyticus]ERB66221.1 pilus assembly protein CpaB [Vibrio coralliilyticus OCN008]KFI09229.1 pilus assembly protein CpaB [Vibrio sp. B183]KJY77435.1 pilus assembly protein CpaB [Vibrio coralliilyticus]NOI20200.1 Flp pilus assembly protein CpaB [Vibrio coralliilyticus]